jgi:hypothetical protein
MFWLSGGVAEGTFWLSGGVAVGTFWLSRGVAEGTLVGAEGTSVSEARPFRFFDALVAIAVFLLEGMIYAKSNGELSNIS